MDQYKTHKQETTMLKMKKNRNAWGKGNEERKLKKVKND